MKSCDEYTEEIILYIYGELEGEAKSALEQHIRGCKACAAELEELSGAHAAAAESKPVPAISLETSERIKWNARKTAAGIIRQTPPLAVARAARSRILTAALAASFLLLTVSVSYFYLSRGRTAPQSPPSAAALSWDSGASEAIDSMNRRLVRLNENSRNRPRREAAYDKKVEKIRSAIDRRRGYADMRRIQDSSARPAPVDRSLRSLRRKVRSLEKEVGNGV